MTSFRRLAPAMALALIVLLAMATTTAFAAESAPPAAATTTATTQTKKKPPLVFRAPAPVASATTTTKHTSSSSPTAKMCAKLERDCDFVTEPDLTAQLRWKRGSVIIRVEEDFTDVVLEKVSDPAFGAQVMLDYNPGTLTMILECPSGYSSVNQYCQTAPADDIDPVYAREPFSQQTLGPLAMCIVRLDVVATRRFALITECAPNFGLKPIQIYSPVAKVSEEVLGKKEEAKVETTKTTTTTQKQKQQGA